MATQMFFRATVPFGGCRGRNDVKLNGVGSGWNVASLRTTRGAGATSDNVGTVAGPTAGIEMEVIGTNDALEWISPPLAAGVTISGTIEFNLRMQESDMNANAGAQCVIERLDNAGAVISLVVNTEKGVELGTAEAAQNWTATPTSTTFAKGDRIRIRVAGNDVGTMGSGFTVTFFFDGPTALASGDSWVTFTENMTFQEANPTGTQLFLTNTASDIVDQGAGVDEKYLATARGDGVQSRVMDTVTGFTTPLLWRTATAGNQIEWYTKPLEAVTLAGIVKASIRALEGAAAANAGMSVEIAVVNGDGTSPIVYGSWGSTFSSVGELDTTEFAHVCYASGPNISITAGQRIRVRVRLDDSSHATVSGNTATLLYHGLSGGSGDSWVQFAETITESGGITVALGQASELDLAQAIAWAPKNRLVGQVAELDLAQVVSINPQRRLVGQVAEVDLAQAIGRVKVHALAQASEVDLAQAVGKPKRLAVGQVSEVDLAQAITALKTRVLAQASEINLAQAIAKAKTLAVGQASEVDLAQAIGRLKVLALAQASELDLAQAIAWAPKHRLVGQAAEVDLAQVVSINPQRRLVDQVAELDVAQVISWAPKRRLLGQATEVDLAQVIGKIKTRMIGQVAELDLAQIITRTGGGFTVAVGQASEIDLAQPIAWAPKRRLLAQASEIDLAQTIGKAKRLGIGQVAEVDLAQLIGVVKLRALGQASEIDLAQPIAWAPKRRLLGSASELDLAQAIGKTKRLLVGQAVEIDLAQLIGVLKLRAVGQVAEVDLAQTIAWSPKRRLIVQVVEVDTASGLVLVMIGPVIGYLETWDEALHDLRVLDEALHDVRVLDQALHDVEVSDGRVSL